MSDSTNRIPYKVAYEIATRVVEELKPFCKRISIAGSVRRQNKDAGDLEVVAIPFPYNIGIFEDGFASVVNRWGFISGKLEYGKSKHVQRLLPEGIVLDLFIPEEGNWGSILAMRTGSSNFSHKVLACGWKRLGFTSDGGYLYKDGIKYGFSEEEDLFKFLGIKYIEPKDRDY